MEKFTVDLNELNKVFSYLAEIEKHQLTDIKWIKDGKELQINPELIEDFRFCGLNNRDFAKIHLSDEY